MTITPEWLAELDAVMAKARALPFATVEWEVAFTVARLAAYNAYPDLRAMIDAQAATIARHDEALREIVGLVVEAIDLERIGAVVALDAIADVAHAAIKGAA